MEFYLNINGNQRGPLDEAEFRELVRNKAVSQEDYVWEAKQGRWIKIKFYAELAAVFEEEATAPPAEEEGYFINVEGKTGGPFLKDAIIKEIERGRFQRSHFVWDAESNRWLKASEHAIFAELVTEAKPPKAVKKYYLSKEGVRHGPFEFGEVEEKILSGEFDRSHYAWEPQLKKWVELVEVADFADIFADLAAPEPEVPPPMPAPEPTIPAPPGPVAPPERAPSEPMPAPPAEARLAPPLELAAPPTEPKPPPGPVGVQPIAPAAEPTVTPPGRGIPEPQVGDLVSISIPPPTADDKPPPPDVSKISVDEVEFKKVSAEEEEVALGKGKDIKIDRTVVLDFSRPSFIRRLAAQLVDLFFISLSYFAVALIFSLLEMNPYLPGPDRYYYQQWFWGVLAGIGVFYFLVRDAGGASIGKRIMELRVVKYDDYDRPANVVNSIIRNITLLIPLLNILDVVYAYTDPKGRTVGDRAAGTVLTESHEIDYLREQRTILDEIY
ncbi:MAG: GYF domain-containing protein [bacterium]